jgi:SAM-dependent methyltransferase
MSMRLTDLLSRTLPPEPWREGDNIPWNEPGFSARMLREHLSQEHDAASRRATTIDRHVGWIATTLLRGQPTALLDLGCGPGLYTSRLARLGHTCVGIDYSPAAIDYARAEATRQNLACRYQLADLRGADYGAGYGLAMLLFGELNVFPRQQATAILDRAHHALSSDGLLLLEPHTFGAVRRMGDRPATWYIAASGLFAATPHLSLIEHFWHEQVRAATSRYFTVDLATGAVTRHAQSFQAYTDDEYAELLESSGFTLSAIYPSLTGTPDPAQPELFVIVARKRGANARN